VGERRITSQILRSSRSVCANFAEAWQKRRYKGAFVSKLNEVEAEAAETQTWIEFAVLCGYLDAETGQELYQRYSEILTGLKRFIENADAWIIK
jgi:four helix bundle protein